MKHERFCSSSKIDVGLNEKDWDCVEGGASTAATIMVSCIELTFPSLTINEKLYRATLGAKKVVMAELGFDKIRQFIKEACYGDIGRELVDKMHFSTDYNLIKMLTIQTEEFCQILFEGLSFPSSNFLDVGNQLDKAKILNTFLTTTEFFDLKRSLDTLYHCLLFFDKQKNNLNGADI